MVRSHWEVVLRTISCWKMIMMIQMKRVLIRTRALRRETEMFFEDVGMKLKHFGEGPRVG